MKKFSIKITPEGRTFSYVLDKTAGVMRCEPIPTEEELKTVYSGTFDYGWYKKRYLLKREQAKHRWNAVKDRVKNGTLLDIGCGHGLFLDFAKLSGAKTFGADFLSPASREAALKGHEVFEGDFLNMDFNGAKFDVITMWHSLEHFINPSEVLKKAAFLLAEGGLLIIAVPNLGCRGFEARGEEWVWIQQPFFHIWHWTPDALIALTGKNGFVKKTVTTRDTWDANIYYDGYVSWWFERGIYFIARKADGFFRRVLKKFNFFTGQAAFYICEPARIFFYILSLLAGKVIKDDLKRSEILMVCEKKQCS